MLCAVIATGDDPVGLVETLAALVPAAMDGLVREAIIVTEHPGEAIVALAEASGARLAEASGGAVEAWRVGAGQARGPWLLLLQAGMVPAPGWTETLARALARRPPPGEAFAFRARREGSRLATLGLGVRGAAGMLARRPSPAHGLVVRLADWPAGEGRLKVRRLPATLQDRRKER